MLVFENTDVKLSFEDFSNNWFSIIHNWNSLVKI